MAASETLVAWLHREAQQASNRERAINFTAAAVALEQLATTPTGGDQQGLASDDRSRLKRIAASYDYRAGVEVSKFAREQAEDTASFLRNLADQSVGGGLEERLREEITLLRGWVQCKRHEAASLNGRARDEANWAAFGYEETANRLEALLPTQPVVDPPAEESRSGGRSLDENGVNQFGVAMCECGNKSIHAWEPGEWCGNQVILTQSKQEATDA